MAAKMMGWGEVSFQSSQQKTNEIFAMINPKEHFLRSSSFRLVGGLLTIPQYWFSVKSDKGKKFSLAKVPTNFNMETGEIDENVECPYTELAKELGVNLVYSYISCGISRREQKNFDLDDAKKDYSQSEEETNFADDVTSSDKTPIRVWQFNSTVGGLIKNTIDLNKVKLKNGKVKVCPPDDPRYGYDLVIKCDPNARMAATSISVNKGDRTPLTEEELEYLSWDLSKYPIDTSEAAEKSVKWIQDHYCPRDDDKKKKNEDDDEDDVPRRRKRSRDEDDDDERPIKSKRRNRDEDDDDEPPARKRKDDWDDDSDDEPPVKSRKRSQDDDDDEDEPPVKNKANQNKKSREEQEEKEPPVKTKTANGKSKFGLRTVSKTAQTKTTKPASTSTKKKEQNDWDDDIPF